MNSHHRTVVYTRFGNGEIYDWHFTKLFVRHLIRLNPRILFK